MKWKFVIILFCFVLAGAGGIAGIVVYYHFDWNVLADVSFYENLANPSMRIVRVQEGLRKEQIADVVGNNLGWDDTEKEQFVNAHIALGPENLEGYYFPKTYMIYRYDDPETVGKVMLTEFNHEVAQIKKPKTTQIINEDTAIKVASIIQREAGGKKDMALISGIIWNRIFKGMKLQIDATLQYAKGNSEDGWWPQVDPQDKKIESPYNTYLYKDLPPSPIANPGIAAITAAYNPQKTNCLFYLHDKNRQIHCAATYAEHLKNIARYY